MNAEFRVLHAEADAAYGNGLYREAADRYERACRMAQARASSDLAFASATAAAGSWHLAGQPLRGLSLVLEALANVPASVQPRDIWMAKLRSFELMRCFRPGLPFLESCLSDLHVLAREHGMKVTADVLRLDALLCRARGQHAGALARFERAWSHIGTFGLHPYLIAYGALFSALALGEFPAVQSWSAELRLLGHQSVEAQAAWLECQARVMLSENQSSLALAMVHGLERLVGRTQQSIWQRRTIMLGARAELLHSKDEDPAVQSHPVWRYLSQSVDGTPEVFDAYDHALLLVDVRLASIRFVLRVPAIDDLYYRQPHQAAAAAGPGAAPDKELERRLDAFRVAVELAEPIAKKLDSAFHCGWRESELNERIRRADELADWYRGTTQRSEQD
jgi:hypothetical protein